jgi:hypothetical protein
MRSLTRGSEPSRRDLHPHLCGSPFWRAGHPGPGGPQALSRYVSPGLPRCPVYAGRPDRWRRPDCGALDDAWHPAGRVLGHPGNRQRGDRDWHRDPPLRRRADSGELGLLRCARPLTATRCRPATRTGRRVSSNEADPMAAPHRAYGAWGSRVERYRCSTERRHHRADTRSPWRYGMPAQRARWPQLGVLPQNGRAWPYSPVHATGGGAAT